MTADSPDTDLIAYAPPDPDPGAVVAQHMERFAQKDPTATLSVIASQVAESGYFADTRKTAQALTKILYGAELGLPPMASVMGIHLIDGKPAPSAQLMRAAIELSGRYDFVIKRHDIQGCAIEFYRDGKLRGVATFTMEDARRAGLAGKTNWRNYPEDMCLSRATSRGFRWFCAGITGGAPVYTPEELGVAVDREGNPALERSVDYGELTAPPPPAGEELGFEDDEDPLLSEDHSE